MRGATIAALAAVGACLCAAASATAGLDSLKAACEPRDAADGDTAGGLALPYRFCDDGVPAFGGTTPNPGGSRAVEVPQRYDGHAGLPPKAAPDPDSGADADGDVALDVDVSLPDPAVHAPPRDGYPLVVMMHGCCSGTKASSEADTVDARGEAWHYSNAWFASRGYAVLTYTARGFVDGQGHGSSGQTQLDSRRYEINDYQHLAGQLADDPFFAVDPRRVVVTGGSYGGGFSWMALTDPTWRSPGGRDMRLVAVAPKFGWTDLVYSLVPNGTGLTTGGPLGVPKRSILGGLYVSGRTGLPTVGGGHATFTPAIDAAFVCLNSLDPFESNPLCGSTIADTLPEFVADRSAYYQDEFFERVRAGERVPLFSAGTFTDPLFTHVEHRRMVERLKQAAGAAGYPVQEYYGDYQHFTQNKPREWNDLCGEEVCTRADGADERRRLGVTTRLNRFIDHYARPPANPSEPPPELDVTASLQVCPATADELTPADEPGLRFSAPSFAELAPERLRIELQGERTTTSVALPNPHAIDSDPLANQVLNGNRCPVAQDPAGPGVAVYDSPPLAEDATLIGSTRLTVPHDGSGSGIMLAARLYDVLPDGRAVMVDRGLRTGVPPQETTVIDLHGNGWRFPAGHRLRVELAQDDEPYLRFSTQPSSLTLHGVTLELPVRAAGPSVRLFAPELASEAGTDARRFGARVEPASGELTGIARVELEARSALGGPWRAVATATDDAGPGRSGGRRPRAGGARPAARGPRQSAATAAAPGQSYAVRARAGRTQRLRARAIDARGVAGPWTEAATLLPLDDSATGSLRYRGAWRRVRSGAAYGGRLSRATGRGAELRFRFRGERVYLVGRRGPRGGRALVLLDGRRRSVSFYAPRSQPRATILSLPVRGRRVHELRLIALGRRGARRSRGTAVEIDALGALRARR